MNREDLLKLLIQAYYNARKNKRNKISQLEFELKFEVNIIKLLDEILEFKYKSSPFNCFIVNNPVKREIFASEFRDRIVHHLLFSELNPLIEGLLQNDIYSCRVGKGTHFGIKRAHRKLQSLSENYSQNVFVLRLDISGYFMNINKLRLFHKLNFLLCRYCHKLKIKHDLIISLISEVLFNDPKLNCRIKCSTAEWIGLPQNKSLFYANENCGLPIGNLTSQLWGNFYLNDFDHWIKTEFNFEFYGRYVDDIVIISKNRILLKDSIDKIKFRLKSFELLDLHPRKIYFQPYYKGFSFLGQFILPYRRYIGRRTLKKINILISEVISKKNINSSEYQKYTLSLESYFGMLKHTNSYRLSKKLEFKLFSTNSKVYE